MVTPARSPARNRPTRPPTPPLPPFEMLDRTR